MKFYTQVRFMSKADLNFNKNNKETKWPFGDEKLKDYPISLFVDYVPSTDELKLNPYNILMIMEPNEFFGLHDFAKLNANYFTCILTWSKDILDNCPNAVLMPHGLSWLKLNYIKIFENINKEYEVSYLCGAKNMIEGHFLRQELYKRENEITIPKKWFYTLPDYIQVNKKYRRTDVNAKKVCWNKSMFHIAIENVKRENFYTEKILDAFLTKTLPIYYGCENIGEYFNENGILTFNSAQEAIEICNSLTENDYYSRIDAINENYRIACDKWNWGSIVYNWMKEFIKENDIREKNEK